MTTPAAQPDAERLARGALLLQGAQVVRLAGGLLILTVLARTLSFAELGTYALLLSLITYVQFVKSSVMNAAVIGVAEAGEDPEAVGRVVCTGFSIYVGLGLASGLLLGGVGLAALPLLNVPEALEASARAGVIGLAVVTALGWPVQIFDDLLRGQQRFAAVSVLEIAGMIAYVGGMVAMLVAGAPLWALVTWTAAVPLITGLLCLLALRALRVRVALGRRLVDRAEARRFAAGSGLLVVGGLAELAIYSLDRAILSAIRSPAAVGRYEGPLQMQNVLRQVHGVISAPVIPAAARYIAAGDRARLRELFVRGLRYTLAATVPFAVVMTVQAGPIMTAWLGGRFAGVASAAALFCGFWIVAANTGVMVTLLLAARRFKLTAALSWAAAVVNLALTLALTPAYGLWGPIVGTIAGITVTIVIGFPISARVAGAEWRGIVREAWLPAYSVGAAVALALLGLREVVDLSGPVAALATLVLVPLVYWAIFAVVWLRPDERVLVRRTLSLRRGPRPAP